MGIWLTYVSQYMPCVSVTIDSLVYLPGKKRCIATGSFLKISAMLDHTSYMLLTAVHHFTIILAVQYAKRRGVNPFKDWHWRMDIWWGIVKEVEVIRYRDELIG